MKNIFKKSTITSLALAFLLGGCTSDFESINTDPDALPQGEPTNMLGYAIRETGTRHGGFDGTEAWAGYVVKIQYPDNYNYLPTNNTYGNKFSSCYRRIVNMRDILKITDNAPDQLKNIRWAARIWEQFLWLLNTDQFGDIPYSQAMGIDEGLLASPYDPQSEIYPSILNDLKTIADEMAAGLGTDKIGDGDFLFGGDAEKWQKFCNSLRLRAAMRIVNVAPDLAKSTIEEICQNPTSYPILETNDENAYLVWQNGEPYYEPWYKDFLSRDDYGMSNIFVAHMLKMKDPRTSAIMKPAELDGEYHGYTNGATEPPSQLKSVSRIGDKYRETPNGFTPFLKSCENFFIIAEAALRGWNVGSYTAASAYEKAVRLSMEDNAVEEAEVEKYLAGSGKWDNTFERLYMEEWVALFKANNEAWCLYRRTGYPKEIQTSGEYPGEFCSFGTAHNDVPFRMPYPDNEYMYNSENINAAAAGIVDNTWGKQMWWDTRTGVK